MLNEKILGKLKDVRERALANYSDFKVGAILVTREGKIYSGHNIESSSYSLTICAERVALFKALSEGERHFQKIYILGSNSGYCPPCGACRQVLMDYAPDIEVVLVNNDGEEKSSGIQELLPLAFTDNELFEKE